MLVLMAGGGGVRRCLLSEDLTDARETPQGGAAFGERGQNRRRHEAAASAQGAAPIA